MSNKYRFLKNAVYKLEEVKEGSIIEVDENFAKYALSVSLIEPVTEVEKDLIDNTKKVETIEKQEPKLSTRGKK